MGSLLSSAGGFLRAWSLFKNDFAVLWCSRPGCRGRRDACTTSYSWTTAWMRFEGGRGPAEEPRSPFSLHRGKRGTGRMCRNGLAGASHKLDQSPFSPAGSDWRCVYHFWRPVSTLFLEPLRRIFVAREGGDWSNFPERPGGEFAQIDLPPSSRLLRFVEAGVC